MSRVPPAGCGYERVRLQGYSLGMSALSGHTNHPSHRTSDIAEDNMASQPAPAATNTPSPDTPAIEAAMQVINLKLSDAQEKAVKEAMQAMLDAQEKKTAAAMRALRVAQDKRDAEKKQENAGIHTQLAYISAQLQDISKSNASNVNERTVFAQV